MLTEHVSAAAQLTAVVDSVDTCSQQCSNDDEKTQRQGSTACKANVNASGDISDRRVDNENNHNAEGAGKVSDSNINMNTTNGN